jgi:hypothetical protein
VIEQESLVNRSSVGSLAGSLVLLLLVIRILYIVVGLSVSFEGSMVVISDKR